MKYLAFLLVVVACSTANAQSVNSSLQKKYIPAEVQGLYIKMPVEELRKARPKAVMPSDQFSLDIKEQINSASVKEITCQFAPGDSMVYEFIIEYKTTAKALAIAKQLYKAPNFVNDRFPVRWKFKIDDGLTLVIWVWQNKICIMDAKEMEL